MSAYEDIGYVKSDKEANDEINKIIGRQTIDSILESLEPAKPEPKKDKVALYMELYKL